VVVIYEKGETIKKIKKNCLIFLYLSWVWRKILDGEY